MILTELERRERSQRSSLPDRLHIRDCRPGRNAGDPTLSNHVREVIGVVANLESIPNGKAASGSTARIAEQFGVTKGQVEYAKAGKNPAVQSKIEESLGVVRDRAMDKLFQAMGLMTTEKLDKCKAPDLARVASSMSQIVERTIPKQDNNQNPTANIKVLIHNMGQVKEDNYAVIEVET